MVYPEGPILCVEPDIYLTGEFGIRAEDITAITADGAEIISNYPYSL